MNKEIPAKILISGKRFDGKTTLAKEIKKIPGYENHVIMHFADILKELYCEKTGIDPIELRVNKEAHRQNLIDFGGEGRKTSKYYWSQLVLNKYDKVIVPDWRYLDEAEVFPAPHTLMIRIEANDHTRIERGWEYNSDVDTHATETELDEFRLFHIYIDNDHSIEDLLEDIKWGFELRGILGEEQ